jgi:hypothetical protein
MLLSESRWTPELIEENENRIHVSTNNSSTSSSFEQTHSSSSSSIIGKMDGRRIYCSGRDLHTISAVRELYFFKFIILFLLTGCIFVS